MCGIILYYNNNPAEQDGGVAVENLVKLATINKHRGWKDGFGIIDFDKREVFKTMLALTEAVEGNVDAARWKKGFKVVDHFRDEIKRLNQVSSLKSNFAALHHRWKSFGPSKIENVHPFKVRDGLYYFHNGSLDCETLRKFMNLQFNTKFESATDTEVIAKSIDMFERRQLSKRPSNNYKTLNFVNDVFKDFGVIVKAELRTKTAHIYKDKTRELFLVQRGNHNYIISEPTALMGGADSCKILKEGYFKLSRGRLIYDEKCVEDVTDKYNHFVSGKVKVDGGNCDCCYTKTLVMNEEGKDYCITCYLNNYAPNENKLLKKTMNFWGAKKK
jgi:glucosamine 6-phosphate synthetase-like amidotransferase/phosphosugar isomerase protein